MPRDITPAMLAAMTSPSWQPVLFVQLSFVSTTVFLSSLYQTIDSSVVTGTTETWYGLGPLLAIGDRIEEGATVEARGIVITLSGLDASLLGDVQNEVQLTLPVVVWLGALSGGAIVVRPVVLWSGGIDQPTIEVTGETASLSIACENLLIGLNTPIDRRLTQQDQTMDWSGDVGLNFVAGLQQQTVYWNTTITTNNI